MAEVKLIGHTTCPECGSKQASILKDRNGNPYRACHWQTGGCGAQYFTRGEPKQAALLLAKVATPAPAGDPAPPNDRLAAPKPAPAADPAPKKRGMVESLYGEKA